MKDLNIIGEYTINKQFSDKTQFNPIFTYMRSQDNIIENSTTPANSKFYHTNEKKATIMHLIFTAIILTSQNNIRLNS